MPDDDGYAATEDAAMLCAVMHMRIVVFRCTKETFAPCPHWLCERNATSAEQKATVSQQN